MTLAIADEIEIKKGKRVQGHLCTLEDGQVIYLARRKHGDIARMGLGTISDAMTAGQAAWGLDEITLFNMRAKKVAIVGVRTTDTKDIYTTQLANFFDLKKAKLRDDTIYGTGRKRLLPLQYFTCAKGAVELPLDKILAA